MQKTGDGMKRARTHVDETLDKAPTNDRIFTLRMPDSLFDAYEQIAIDEGRTIADVVRRALAEQLEPLHPDPSGR